MPSSYTGTKEERLARLEARGQRCDGAGHTCPQTAIKAFQVIAVNPATGEPREGAKEEIRRGCSKHHKLFGQSANYRVIGSRVIPAREVSREERKRGTLRNVRMRGLIGCAFLPTEGAGEHVISHVKYVVDDVQITDTHGEQFMLRDVYQVTGPTDDTTRTSADDDQDATESARRVEVPLGVIFSG